MALNDISLTAGMRNNLISLQSTTTLLNRTQDRLSTGKKVNTALDNPTNFFAAQSHTQRAADLTTRKDGMTEGVQGVQAANKGITAITALIEAAKGLTQAARSADSANRDTLAQQFNTIRTQIDQLASDSGYKGKNFLDGDNLTVLFNEAGGSSLTISGFDASSTGMGITNVTVAVAATTTTAAGTTALAGSGVISLGTHTATLSSGLPAGYVATSTFFVGDSGTVVVDANALSGASMTFNYASLTSGGASLAFTGAVTLNKIFVDGVDQTAAINAKLTSGITSAGSGQFTITFTGAALSGVGGIVTGSQISFEITITKHMDTGSLTVPSVLNTFDLAAGDVASGLQKNVASGVEIFVSGTYIATGNYTLTGTTITFVTGVVPPSAAVTYRYNSGYTATSTATVLTKQTVFTGQTLNANETITAVSVGGVAVATGNYTITGSTITFTSGIPNSGQAITYTVTTTTAGVTGGWETDAGIDASVTQLNTAISTLRTQSSNLASNLSVVTIRQDFTDGMVNTLLKGADNLTLADMNEEGANMLMLQTRQQLGTTSLKMASDAAQAVLRLF
jgi:flagellin-like hook-associated protein FlgL